MFLIVHSTYKAFFDTKNVSTSTQSYEFARLREEEEILSMTYFNGYINDIKSLRPTRDPCGTPIKKGSKKKHYI